MSRYTVYYCPPGYPVDCGNRYCCPSGTYCGTGRTCPFSGSSSSGGGSGSSSGAVAAPLSLPPPRPPGPPLPGTRTPSSSRSNDAADAEYALLRALPIVVTTAVGLVVALLCCCAVRFYRRRRAASNAQMLALSNAQHMVSAQQMAVFSQGGQQVAYYQPGALGLQLSSSPLPLPKPPPPHAATKYFAELDTDGDGFITGNEARDFFLRSELPTQTLGAIWESFPRRRYGHLDAYEFEHMFAVVNKAGSR